jgi:zinc D-Ala-D-Ala carboxypeptidase
VLRVTRLCLAVAFALSGIFVAGGTAPSVALAGGAPPECRYDDITTQYTSPADWRITLVDTIYELPQSYMPPPGLVSTADAGLNGGQRVRRFVVPDLTALAKAARKAGAPLRIVSAYRSYGEQSYLYQREVRNHGLEAGRLLVARPGHSEHHLGTTIDFGSANTSKKGWNYADWAQTKAGSWMYRNGWKFGFVMSYPRATRAETCYGYEPWHYRYVGREMASDIHDAGTTLREYLWRNFH